jgi:uncharacterized RDD family membrane protein YckC
VRKRSNVNMVEIEDRYVTSTPEGVPLSFVLAGLGSRASAYLIDVLVQVVVDLIALLALIALVFSSTSAFVAAGIYSLISFVVMFGYFVIFETLDSGRSLGKRALGIRVTRIDGSGVTFRASLVRNLLRVLYLVPIFYLVDALLILSTRRNQRMGDLIGGTLVIRDRIGAVDSLSRGNWADPGLWSGAQVQSPWAHAAPGPVGPWAVSPSGPHHWGPPQPGTAVWGPPGYQVPPPPPRLLPPELATWDVSAVTPADLVVVQAYLARRFQYDPQPRHKLAEDLARRMWPKVAGPTGPMEPERFLEALALVKSSRG